MNFPHNLAKAARLVIGAGLAFSFMVGCGKAPVQKAAAKKPASTVKTKVEDAPAGREYVSVFEDSARARDPFFPDSHRREPSPVRVASESRKSAVATDLLLKGIVGSASHRLAVINNEILEIGEEGLVHVPTGQVRVRCLTIGSDFVVIKVDGEAQSKRLFMEKKNY